jgi:hypothetical protein
MTPRHLWRRLNLASLPLRRGLVVSAVAITAIVASAFPPSLHGFGPVAVFALIVVDLALVASVEAVPFARGVSLDERERALRDRAYRLGFRLLGLAFAVLVVLWIIGSILSAEVVGAGSSGELDAGISGRLLVAVIELLTMMPTFVLAWGHVDVAGRGQVREDSRRLPWMAWLVIPAMILAWILDVVLVPAQAAVASTLSVSSTSLQGASCAHFVGGRVIGAEFGATVGLRVEACWNGVDAFVFGDPSFPLPSSALARLGEPGSPMPPQYADPAIPSLTECGGDDNDDFAAVSVVCTATIDPAGTLHYTERAHVTPLPFSLGQRNVTLTLVVTKDGTVTARP